MLHDAVTGTALAAQDPGGTSIDGRTGAILVVGILVAVVVSIALFFGRVRRRRVSMQKALDDDVAIGLRYLDEQLDGLPVASSQAVLDASGRLAVARSALADDRSVPVLRAVRHTLLEGLAAAHFARAEAGLDPGPVPPPPSEAPMATAAADVTVDGRTWSVSPAYRPGFGHHFPGGRLSGVAVAGGWYAEPFWERLLTPDEGD